MKTIASLAALAAAFLVVPATAQGPAAPSRSMIVKTADLDLTSARGLARLDLRVHRAAVALCGKSPDFDVRGRNLDGRCVASAKAKAAATVTAAIAAARPGMQLAASR